MKHETWRIKSYFHSALCDPNNPYSMYPGISLLNIAQFQKGGKIVWIVDYQNNPQPKNCLSPAQLQK
jgi:hypothetical protein